MSIKAECGVAARLQPSPNHNERQLPIDMLVLHYTAMEDTEAALRWLCDPRSEVSAHYLVKENGGVVQCVPEGRRAWHAGVSSWKGESDINSRSIGIEIANAGVQEGEVSAFPPVQIEAVIALCQDILSRHAIPAAHVLGHSDVAPARKQDPGRHFPWAQLAAAGVGHYLPPVEMISSSFFQEGDNGQPIEALQSLLGIYGYGVTVTGVFDQATKEAVAAFQRHFRPSQVDGIADTQTIASLHALLKALPTLD
ncbi:N-acetylmuramoyl-L-alanine amidase [Polycladidibacter hongkongensis]|uniref:N-acetylmuramoyl-L-alanine amidase n=1 Tax=Polycladidibacter hongkongensis TaxID=1647556 RepID=UPI00083172FB|nr:N-acetylmuramoyl-L-alanine amidase [Pseudovibrio hongkongensis]